MLEFVVIVNIFGREAVCNSYQLLLIQERETDRFSQFITECFTTYCKKKRREEKRQGKNILEIK